jgi:hypothetical protein
MKRILVIVASLAVALAASFGASAHPFGEPTPPTSPAPRVDDTAFGAQTDAEQEGDHPDGDQLGADHQDGNMDEAQATDVNASDDEMDDSDDEDLEAEGED